MTRLRRFCASRVFCQTVTQPANICLLLLGIFITTNFDYIKKQATKEGAHIMFENAQQSDTELKASAEFRQLDPRVIKLWRSVGLITASVFLLALLIVAITAGEIYTELSPWLFGFWVLLLVACGWLIYWRPPRLYRSWGYRIDERVLETRSGLLFQVRRLLPLTRLQHVDLHRGPIERAYGLATLVLHTAGTQEAKITIPGLDAEEAARLRDHLVEVGGDDAV